LLTRSRTQKPLSEAPSAATALVNLTADARAADIREFSRAIRQREVTMRMAPPATQAASGTKR
jgi:hypothetical protein